jgi:hypothetical protein
MFRRVIHHLQGEHRITCSEPLLKQPRYLNGTKTGQGVFLSTLRTPSINGNTVNIYGHNTIQDRTVAVAQSQIH